MRINTQLDTEIETDTVINPRQEFVVLQAILATRDETIGYEETAEIGYELLGFFEALGEENMVNEDSDA